ncbi:MAG: FAD-dependent oxidoreductase [Chloroflexota bacterium]
MNKQNRIVVIGGTACGPKAAARARRCDPGASITLVEQREALSSATCGFPYYVSGVIASEGDLVARKPDFFKNVMDIEVLPRTRATAIDRKDRRVDVLDLQANRSSTIEYDKLVLATGSRPFAPQLPGRELGGILGLSSIEDALALRNIVSQRKTRKAVVVGAGLIGIEMAEAFASHGLEVTLVELLGWVLPTFLDFEIAAYVAEHIQAKGVKLLLGKSVTGFEGDSDGWVRKVNVGDTALEAGVVLLALGVRPDVGLAREAGLRIGPAGGISVNERLQTSDPNIYAGGDCVENIHLVTRQKVLAPLGSTANKHGRVIGTNVTGGSETFPGVLGTAAVKVFGYNVARVGISETEARKAGYDVVTSLVPGHDHADYYPGDKDVLVKLVVEKASGRILGGQVAGPGDVAKRVDVLATALTFGATVDAMANLDLTYAPPYNSAFDPLHHAANVVRNKLAGYARALTPMEVKDKLDKGADFVLLDVRRPDEWKAGHIKATQAVLLPLEELRAKLDTLPRDREIVIYCKTSVRAYQAQRILDGAGFQSAAFMDGSLAAWPYEVAGKKPRSE